MSVPGPHKLSPAQLRRRLNLYPPYLFNRIRIVAIGDDFRTCSVRVKPSLLTRNLQGTLFGGTIYSASDAIHALLYWQSLAHRGVRVQAWVKTATIRFRRPARALTLLFEVESTDVELAAAALESTGRHACTHTVAATDETGVVCAEVDVEVVLRRPRLAAKDRPSF